MNRYINVGNGIAQIDAKEYTAEPRIRFGSAGSPLSGFLAGYFFHAKQKEVIDLFGGGGYDDRTETKAVFGEVTWQPSEPWKLVLGARYEKEDRDRVGGTRNITPIDFHRSFDAFLPRATLSFRPSEGVTIGATAGRGYNAGGAGVALNAPFPSFTYEKETVWNYEGFVRVQFGGLRLNANVFLNDFDGLQLPFDVASNPAAPAFVIRNAEKATTYGAEFEARYKAMQGLDLFGSFGLLKTKINRYADRNIQGKELPRAPAFSFNAGIAAKPFGGFDVSFDVRYTDSYFSDAFNNARGKTKPYMVANGQIAYRFDRFRVYVNASNLFDANEPILYSIAANPANDLATIVRSRRVTGGVEVRF